MHQNVQNARNKKIENENTTLKICMNVHNLKKKKRKHTNQIHHKGLKTRTEARPRSCPPPSRNSRNTCKTLVFPNNSRPTNIPSTPRNSPALTNCPFPSMEPNTERITTRVQAGVGATRQPKAHLTRSANHLQIYFSFVERPSTLFYLGRAGHISPLSRNSRFRTRATRKRQGGGSVSGHRFPASSILVGGEVSEKWQECWPRVCLFPLCCR